ITFLEGSGYMARAAFVMDRVMHAIGLHGKSFIPMVLGFGCNVPAIYATRTLENTRDKVLTALLVPLMSCSARLPVYMLFVGVFFSTNSGTVMWSIYVLGVTLAVLMGIVFKHTLFRGETPMFIMELPPYRMPSFKHLAIHSWEKGKHFMIKAGSFIVAMSVLVWFLLNLPWGVQDKRDSYLGMVSQTVAPVFKPLGFGRWEAVSALMTGVIAKEIVISTMGEIYSGISEKQKPAVNVSFGEELREMAFSLGSTVKQSVTNVFSSFIISSISESVSAKAGSDISSSLKNAIKSNFTPLSAYAFMVFVLLYMPCLVTAIAFKQEFGTWRWFGLAVAYGMSLAWVAAFLIYQGGKFLKIGV
ncbi:MAG: ferrous iron transport protein B, partial [Nitrospirae bacterium]|nr:ferrous iron transport protein B [Nitrospirota bacterium]